MISIRFLEFLLLLLHPVYSQEAEPVFRAEGTNIEMGYCFGVDYIVVYRCAPEGDQLLGNSSANSAPITHPADLQGRIHINEQESLLGLQISKLTPKDSGIYRRECWQNRTRVSQHLQWLFVCNEEVDSEEIIVKAEDGGAKLLCLSTSIGLEGTSVRWYHEMSPSYEPKLFLDSSVSLDTELQGVVEVRDNGASLLLDNSTLKYNHHFTCLVSKGETCLSFQSMSLPDRSESKTIFASQGDRVVLKCPFDGDKQQWETPMGTINGSSEKIARGDKSEDFSLVIPAVSDEHIGDYSCISSSFEMHYLLVLCPKKESQEKIVVEGGSILLDCDTGAHNYQGVQWHRRGPSSEYELIHDSNDKSVPIPEDLKGRLILSENGSSLIISHIEVKDRGEYLCIGLGGTEFLEDTESSKYDYYEEDAGEEDFSDGLYWEDTHKCLFQQKTLLSVIKTRNIGVNLEPVPETGPTADPPANVTAYAVGGGLVGLLVVGVIVAVVAVKRAKASPKQRKAASRSGLNTTKDIKMNMEPDCTQSLTYNDECV